MEIAFIKETTCRCDSMLDKVIVIVNKEVLTRRDPKPDEFG